MMKTEGEIVGSCKVLDISKLTVSPFNARRQNEESLQSENFIELCDSIRANGLIEPIVVRPINGRYEVVAGTRRFAALKQIGAKQAPTIVKEMDDNDVRIASLVENIHRSDLTEDEKEETLRQIYLVAWDEWRPEERKGEERDYSTDENKIKLARSYLVRLQNEAYQSSAIYPRNSTQSRIKNKGESQTQQVFPTRAFIELRDRVGYAASTQYNILRGYGALSANRNFVDELPPTIRELVEQAAREKKLREEEKQHLAKIAIAARRKIKGDQKRPKTQKQKIQRTIKTFTNTVERRRKATEERKKRSQQQIAESDHKVQRQVSKVLGTKMPTPKMEQSAVRAREDIVDIGTQLFKILTAQELDTGNLQLSEIQAKSVQAIYNMQELASFYATPADIAAQQHIIIPLNNALSKYRDILYEAAENRKDKDEMMRP